MSIVAIEGIVEGGQVRLDANVRLPDWTKVYVVVPEVRPRSSARIVSPRLAHPERAADFEMEVSEESANASL